MGKKYLETKKDSLEASVLNVWQKAVEQTQEITDNAQMLKNPEENTQKEEVDLDEAKKSQGMFIVLEKGSKNKVIGQFKDKKKAIAMMKKSAGSKVIQIGKFATDDDKPVDIKVGDELSYTRVKLSTKIKEETELDEARQLKDPKKEVMVVKGNKVVVIDKKDEKKYLQKGYKLAEASGDKEAYTKFFNSALKKFKVNSPAELKGDAKKKFYDYVDKNWEGDNEKAEAAMAQVREFKIQGMKAALASIWNVKEGKNPFKVEDDKKVKSKDEKTMTGKKAAIIDLKPKIKD